MPRFDRSCFVPCTPTLNAYDAIQFYLGGEGDKVSSPNQCSVCSQRMAPLPIQDIRVGTPFFFVNVPITSEYTAVVDGIKLADRVGDAELSKQILKDKWSN